ncbi:putative zinc finger/BTB domain protein [Thalictrum thalictroides]|uniref:Putative zinc finger/BTB domain protein n=1 Tax=Thalictrum thalictroides TaxID=46969 RepID=A0A7J6V521_THATH|nr:putative zinc finger/BTB domain protein [Thalictrum thalictroides]
MTTGTRVRRRIVSRRHRSTPYSLPSCNCEVLVKDAHKKMCTKALEKGDWEDATCSVCLEYPHNAVLLLCSSHDKGCRPYMCATSYRYSNCLDQYEKAYKKVASPHHGQPEQESADYSNFGSGPDWPVQKCEGLELACPLCRGQVKGWTVVEAARKYLNAKRRTCMQEKCSFIGTYKELRKHVKREHPSARPREVDPILEQKWRRLEREREREDVMSTIRSSMPGAMVLGDYVIERNHHNFDMDDEGADDDDEETFDLDDRHNVLNLLFLLHASHGRNGRMSSLRLDSSYHQPSNGEGVQRGMSVSAAPHVAVSSEGEDDSGSPRSRRSRRRVVGPVRSVRRLGRN